MKSRVARARVIGVLAAGLLGLLPAAASAAAPANDHFADAEAISEAGGAVAANNDEATEELGEPNHGSSKWDQAFHSVWWKWTASHAGATVVSTCDSEFDTRMGVYTGSAVDSLATVAGNEDSSGPNCSGSKFAETKFNAHPGETYFIAVDTSGDLAGSGMGKMRGEIKLDLDAPTPSNINPSTYFDGASTFTMPRFAPRCKSKHTTPYGCDEVRGKPRLWPVSRVRKWVTNIQAGGTFISYSELGVPASKYAGGGFRKHVQKAIKRNPDDPPVLFQSIPATGIIPSTAGDPAELDIHYFSVSEDRKAEKALLEKIKKGKEAKKAKCLLVREKANPEQLERLLGAQSFQDASDLLAAKPYKCGLAVRTLKNGKPDIVRAPGLISDHASKFSIDKGRDVIEAQWRVPVAQDLVLTLREDPDKMAQDYLSFGQDGMLTASKSRVNAFTVQVTERLTGRLVQGADVTFFDKDGDWSTQETNAIGETTFYSRVTVPKGTSKQQYALTATAGEGGGLEGFRNIPVVNRKGKSFQTTVGRTMAFKKLKGKWSWFGSEQDLDRARQLPLVPASFGTGMTQALPTTPSIRQGKVIARASGGMVTGNQNVVEVPNNSNLLVGADDGLIVFAGGLPDPAPGQSSNPFGRYGDLLRGIVGPLQSALERGSSAPGTIAYLAAADRERVRQSAIALSQFGAAQPTSNLISDKGLGLIGQAGGNIISDKGLGLIGQAGGNLISDQGAGLISDKGLGFNVVAAGLISDKGMGVMPVYGGNIISRDSAG